MVLKVEFPGRCFFSASFTTVRLAVALGVSVVRVVFRLRWTVDFLDTNSVILCFGSTIAISFLCRVLFPTVTVFSV